MEEVTTRKEEYREGNTSVPFQEIWAEELRKLLRLYCWSNPIHCRLGVTHPLAASTSGDSETGRNVNNAGNLSGTQGYLLHLNVRCQPQMSIFKKKVESLKGRVLPKRMLPLAQRNGFADVKVFQNYGLKIPGISCCNRLAHKLLAAACCYISITSLSSSSLLVSSYSTRVCFLIISKPLFLYVLGGVAEKLLNSGDLRVIGGFLKVAVAVPCGLP